MVDVILGLLRLGFKKLCSFLLHLLELVIAPLALGRSHLLWKKCSCPEDGICGERKMPANSVLAILAIPAKTTAKQMKMPLGHHVRGVWIQVIRYL